MRLSQLAFAKLHGSGNDFIFFDNREKNLPRDPAWIAYLCHRKFGIGADGVIFVEPSDKADVTMRIFNSNGTEAESCGNGLCCLYRFLAKTEPIDVEIAGNIVRMRASKGQVALQLVDRVSLFSTHILDGKKLYFLHTGVPHTVCFVEKIDSFDVDFWGKKIQKEAFFAPSGTNVNFAEIQKDASIRVRTFERGVQQETLACGTGSTAVALVAMKEFSLQSPVAIHCEGGKVFVDASCTDQGFEKVLYTGNATFVFSGTIDMPKMANKKEPLVESLSSF